MAMSRGASPITSQPLFHVLLASADGQLRCRSHEWHPQHQRLVDEDLSHRSSQ